MKKHLSKVLSALVLALILFYAPSSAAKYVFIYNHPDLDWYVIETEHFNIYYPVSHKKEGNDHYLSTQNAARLAARVAEELWPRECSHFGYFIKEKMNIVIVNQSDYLEGFTIPPWDWIVISVNPGSYFYRQRSRMEWMSDVLAHEFGHVVSLKQDAPFSEGTYGVLVGGLYDDGIHDQGTGVEVFVMDSDPHFWVEGTAEGTSDSAAYNWWTTARDMNIRMTTLQGRLLELKDLHGLLWPYGWNDWERSYQQGYSFGLYLKGRFGYDVYAKVAEQAGKHWRAEFLKVFEEVTGVPAETLFEDWKQYVTEHYQAQAKAILAKGEAAGRELLSEKPDWEFTSPSEREKWKKKRYYERFRAREATGTWVMEPRYDAESGIFGVNWRGSLMISQVPIDEEVAFTGSYPSNPGRTDRALRYSATYPIEFMHGWDFVPGKKQVVITGNESMFPSLFTQISRAHVNVRGYSWKQLWVVDLVERKDKKHGVEYETWQPKTVLGRFTKWDHDHLRPIPNTLRGTDPAVSPDGKRIAFMQYADGTTNLAVIDIDGSNKKLLTHYEDGTWFQRPDWSPDGKQIVFAMFRNHQQNLYVINADGTGLRAITWDAWEEQDAHWGADGKIYFSADPDGVYNIYRYDPETGRITQLTNVVGGAECPIVTPEGNLVYIYYDAFGWKLYGLDKADFFNVDATDKFRLHPDQEVVDASLAYVEDLSDYEALTRKFHWGKKYLVPPNGYLMFHLENDTQTNWGLQAGGVIWLQDYLEMQGMVLYGYVGEDNLLYAQYYNQMWYPNIYLTAIRYMGKSDYGYWVDLDDRTDTTEDQYVLEGKRSTYQTALSAMVELPWNERWFTSVFVYPWEWGFRYIGDPEWKPYQREVEAGLDVSFTANPWDAYSANPRSGRAVEATVTHGWTDIVFEDYGGVSVDDGELLDEYEYNKYELRWTEQMNVPTFGVGFLEKAQKHGHHIQLDVNVGWIDRNVALNDEFIAGGKHPYDWGNGSLRPNTLFSGYPAWSLFGETMAIANLAYRFPVREYINYRVGPYYLGSIYCQVGGTAGNLWSFRPPDDPDLYYRSGYNERIARDPSDIEREIPFVDYAYKNSPADHPNYLLYDAQIEFRVVSKLFAASWNSFLRLAYGFNEIRGVGDVNGDGIYDTSENALNDELSNETEPPGLRVYVGLGTGW